MSLRLVQRPGRPHWYVRGTVRGESVFESTGTDDKKQAEGYRVKREGELWTDAIYGQKAKAGFGAAVESYVTTQSRSSGQTALVNKLLVHFGDRPLRDIGQAELDRACAALLRPDAAPSTKLRNVITPLRAIMEHAARRGWCDRPAFEVPRQPKPRVSYILPAQATALVQSAAPHLRPLIVFLITTAARMSEALELDWSDVDLDGTRVTFTKTKNGVQRRVDLVPAAVAALSALPHRTGPVFRPAASRRADGTPGRRHIPKGTPLGYANNGRTGGGQIKTGWAVACQRAGLPDLHPHDLRHVAATWHYALHRDLLRLQQWGGWSSVTQVQVYAHVLPEAYIEQVRSWLGLVTEKPKRKRA